MFKQFVFTVAVVAFCWFCLQVFRYEHDSEESPMDGSNPSSRNRDTSASDQLPSISDGPIAQQFLPSFLLEPLPLPELEITVRRTVLQRPFAEIERTEFHPVRKPSIFVPSLELQPTVAYEVLPTLPEIPSPVHLPRVPLARFPVEPHFDELLATPVEESASVDDAASGDASCP